MWRAGLCVLLLLLSLRALAAESLTWAILPNPGAVDLRDEQPREGLGLEFLRLLEPLLVDVQVQYRVSNLLRSQQDMARGRNLCSVFNLSSPERDQIGYFVTLLIIPPMQLVIRRGDAGRLPWREGRLWTDDVFASALRGGIFIQRRYPSSLQARLTQELEQNRLIGVNMAANGDRVLQMLSHGRFDYTFEYPPLVLDFAHDNPQLAPLLSVPVADISQLPVLGSYCTRNEWGRAMAARIDSAVRAMMAEPQQVQALYQRWLPAESYQNYQREIHDFMRLRAQQP